MEGMKLRGWSAAVLLLAPLAAACGADGPGEQNIRTSSPRDQTPTQGIGPSGDVGPAPHDMPGAGRGSATPRGK